MAGSQLNLRLSAGEDEELARWSAERGIERTVLAKDFLREGFAALRAGRAMFERPAQVAPNDVQHLITQVSTLAMEVERVHRQLSKHDAARARQARLDTQGVSEAGGVIIEATAALIAPLQSAMAKLQAAQSAGPDVSSEIADLAGAIARADNGGRFDEIAALQRTNNANQQILMNAILNNTDYLDRISREPRTTSTYQLWPDGWEWSGRKILLAGFATWFICVMSLFPLAKIVPTWLIALPAANLLLGSEGEAIYKLQSYRTSMVSEVRGSPDKSGSVA